MSDIKSIVDEKIYRQFKGTDWPPFDDFISSNYTTTPEINTEILSFIETMKARYNNLALTKTVELSEANQKRQKQIFFDKEYQGQSRCTVPWRTLGVNVNGNIFICQSPSWIPIFIGNLQEATNIYDILNNDLAKKIRREILENRYFYCNSNICGFFQHQSLNLYKQKHITQDTNPLPLNDREELYVRNIPADLIFDFDYTCNFRCPSCRTEAQNWNADHIQRPINNRIVEQIKHLIIDEIKEQPISIRWCGGEPFMSDVYIELFNYIISTGKTNIQNVIQTNGSLLINKSKLVENFLPFVKELRISFDAGCSDTYKLTRVGGNWDNLLENVKFVKQLVKEKNLATKIYADFVVQKNNYKDLPMFAEMCNQLKLQMNIQKMWNWGTWDNETFDDMNVYTITHPLYNDVAKQFKLANLPMAKN